MPADAPPVVTSGPKDGRVSRSVLEGIFPKDLGADNAEQVAKANLVRIQSRSSQPINPPAPEPAKPPESAQLKALEQFSNPQPGSPEVSTVKPGQEPVAPQPPAPEPVPAPANESTPSLAADLPDPGFADNDLLAALQKKPEAAKPVAALPTESLLTGAADPAAPTIEEDLDAPIVIPKKAEEIQNALIKTSKLLREKQKKIKELEARGSIDTAAIAVEPLQQRIAALEAEKLQLTNIAAGTQLENLPDFQQRYVRPMQAAEAFLQDVAKANEGISVRELFTATQKATEQERHAAVRAACADLHPSDALRVEQAVDAIHDIGVEWEKIKGNAGQIMANIQKQQQEAQLARQATMRAESIKAHERQFNDFMTNPVLAQFAAKDPAVKEKLDAVLAAAKAAETDTRWVQNHDLRARAIQQALAFPIVEKLYQNKLAEVLGELKKERAKRINLQGGSGLPTSPRTNYTPPVSQNVPVNGSGSVADLVHGVFKGKL